jgi:DNA-binding IclR family transcriptional regulator
MRDHGMTTAEIAEQTGLDAELLRTVFDELVAQGVINPDPDGRMSMRDGALLVATVSPSAMAWVIDRIEALSRQTDLERAKEQVRMYEAIEAGRPYTPPVLEGLNPG